MTFSITDSGVNGKPAYHILFCLDNTDEIRKEYLITSYSVDSRNFKKWGRSPTTTQNVGEGLKILGDDFMISLN